MPNAREFTTVWGFKIEHDKLDRVEQQLEGIKHRLDFLAAAEVAHKLFELTERFSKFAEELHLTAESAGLTVEAFQKMAFSAGHAAVSQDELATSLARLSRSLYAARTGSQEAQKAFADAGFSPEQVKGFKNSQEAMLAFADKIRGIQDPIKRSALTMELLGRGSQRMVGYLAQGSAALRAQGVEAERLGLILSEHQVEALTKVEHALQNFWGLLKNIGATIAAQVAPSLEYLIKDFLEFFKVNRAVVELNFRNWIYNVTFAIGYLWGWIKTIVTALVDLAKKFELEGYILPSLAAITSLVVGMWAAARVFAVVQSLLGPFIAVLNILRNSWLAVAAAEWLAEAPLLAIAGIIGIVILAVDQLWAKLSGRPSWLSQFWEWIKALDLIHGGLSKIGSILPSGVLGAIGLGDGKQGSVPSGVAGPVGGNSSQYSVNAPISISVGAAGADPGDVGKQAREGVRDHLNRVLRETQRSTTSAIAY